MSQSGGAVASGPLSNHIVQSLTKNNDWEDHIKAFDQITSRVDEVVKSRSAQKKKQLLFQLRTLAPYFASCISSLRTLLVKSVCTCIIYLSETLQADFVYVVDIHIIPALLKRIGASNVVTRATADDAAKALFYNGISGISENAINSLLENIANKKDTPHKLRLSVAELVGMFFRNKTTLPRTDAIKAMLSECILKGVEDPDEAVRAQSRKNWLALSRLDEDEAHKILPKMPSSIADLLEACFEDANAGRKITYFQGNKTPNETIAAFGTNVKPPLRNPEFVRNSELRKQKPSTTSAYGGSNNYIDDTITLNPPSNTHYRPPLSQSNARSRRDLPTNSLPVAPPLPTDTLGSMYNYNPSKSLGLPRRASAASRPIQKQSAAKRLSEAPNLSKPMRYTSMTTATSSNAVKPDGLHFPTTYLKRSPIAVTPEHQISSSVEDGSHSISMTFTSHASMKPPVKVEEVLESVQPALSSRVTPLPFSSPASSDINTCADAFMTPVNNVKRTKLPIFSPQSPSSSRSTSKNHSQLDCSKSALSEDYHGQTQQPSPSNTTIQLTPFSKDAASNRQEEYSSFCADNLDDITLPRIQLPIVDQRIPVNAAAVDFDLNHVPISTLQGDSLVRSGEEIYVIAKNDSKNQTFDRLEDASNIRKSERHDDSQTASMVEGNGNCAPSVAQDPIATSSHASVVPSKLTDLAPNYSIVNPYSHHLDYSAAPVTTTEAALAATHSPYPTFTLSPPKVSVAVPQPLSPSLRPVSAAQSVRSVQNLGSNFSKRFSSSSSSSSSFHYAVESHPDTQVVGGTFHPNLSSLIPPEPQSMSSSSSTSSSSAPTSSTLVQSGQQAQSGFPSLPSPRQSLKFNAVGIKIESPANSSSSRSQLKGESSNSSSSPILPPLNLRDSIQSQLLRSNNMINESTDAPASPLVQPPVGRFSFAQGNVSTGPISHRMSGRGRLHSPLIPNTPDSGGRSNEVGLSVALSDNNSDRDLTSPKRGIHAPDLDSPFPTPLLSRSMLISQSSADVANNNSHVEQNELAKVETQSTSQDEDDSIGSNQSSDSNARKSTDMSKEIPQNSDSANREAKSQIAEDPARNGIDESQPANAEKASRDGGTAAQQIKTQTSVKYPKLQNKSSDEAPLRRKPSAGISTSKPAGTVTTARKADAAAGSRQVKRPVTMSLVARKSKPGPDSKAAPSSIGNTMRSNSFAGRRFTAAAAASSRQPITSVTATRALTQRKSLASNAKGPGTSKMTVTVRPTAPTRRPVRPSSAIGNIFGKNNTTTKKEKESTSNAQEKATRQNSVTTIGRAKSSVAAVGRVVVRPNTSSSNDPSAAAPSKDRSTHAASSASLREALRRPSALPLATRSNSGTAKATASLSIKPRRPTAAPSSAVTSTAKHTLVIKPSTARSMLRSNSDRTDENGRALVSKSSSGSEEVKDECSLEKCKTSISTLRTMFSRGRGDWRRRHEKMKEVKNGLETLDGTDLNAEIARECIIIIHDAMNDIHHKMMVMALDCLFLLLLRTSGPINSTALQRTLEKRIDVLRRVLHVCKDSKEDVRLAGERVLTSFQVQFTPERQVALLLRAMNFIVENTGKNNAARFATNNPSTTSGMDGRVMEVGCVSISKALERAEACDGFVWAAPVLETVLKAMFRLSKDRRQKVRHSANDVVKAVHGSLVETEGAFDLACTKAGVKFALSNNG